MVSRFSVWKFLSDCTKKFHWTTIWCFWKLLLSKIFVHRKGGGITILSIFFVPQDRNEIFCKGTLLFSRNFLVSKKIYGWEGAYHDFQSKFICLSVPKIFVRECYCFWESFWLWTVLWMKRAHFPSKIFGLTVPKNFESLPWKLLKVWGSEKFYAYLGVSRFPPKISGLTVPKNFVGILSMFQKNWGIEIFFFRNSGYHVFPSKNCCLTVPKKFIGEHCGVSEKIF